MITQVWQNLALFDWPNSYLFRQVYSPELTVLAKKKKDLEVLSLPSPEVHYPGPDSGAFRFWVMGLFKVLATQMLDEGWV